jgi:capsular polysaccharide export protein
VIFLQSGPFMPIVRHACGLVTINSTSGIAALAEFIPVLTLGDAFYQGEGLACHPETDEDLDAFWSAPPPVDPFKTVRFREHVRRQALVPGSFYLRHSWPSMTEGVIERLKAVLGD